MFVCCKVYSILLLDFSYNFITSIRLRLRETLVAAARLPGSTLSVLYLHI